MPIKIINIISIQKQDVSKLSLAELQQLLLQQQKEQEQHHHEPEDRGPDVPVEMLKDSLSSMHIKFVHDFDEKERLLVGKIKELEIKLADKQAAAQAAAAKKLNAKSPKR